MTRPARPDLALPEPFPGDSDEAIVIPAVAADGSLFPIGKMEAHRLGVMHLAVSVFVMSGDRILLQKRADGKYHCAGLWANSCCSHPQWGESAASAARRRLREELGLVLDLRETAELEYAADVSDGLRECEHVHVFIGLADHRTLVVAADPQEVSQTRWATRAEIESELAGDPDSFAPWFRIYMDRWPELGLDPR
jgi:isopentenyl-diphosphate delta-isomerase